MPDLIQNGQYFIKISDTNNQFAEVISESFTYYELPDLSLNYSINYDTLEFNITGDTEFVSGIFVSPNSELSIQDSLFIFAEEGEFTFTVNAQNSCGSIQLTDTIYSTINTSIITGIDSENCHNINTYPNPVEDYLYIENSRSQTWKLYSISGQELISRFENLDNKIKVDLTDLKPGIYYIRNTVIPFESIKFLKK
jgi:hypothetical protein